ncbi:60S ribosomal protein L5 [Raphidocelis subcapitata]|uniref:60S ribosomal protein L5 n=1 Tax=Raphidocelis subcapitata TaxID=307507 RepID=A0A2V0P8A3_9CHLO|nr:60S ribosomal protein L5 [Raphidocelis subcapitata]|eukprot:GBF93315.1 60S ribosomal protein L5 [Raphidocelis subcapitata]
MGYVKVVKTSSYFSRYQVKYRRRRSGKTDYRARLRLCTQDKNKYNTHKYRLVVRFSNRDITCQVVYSSIAGDVVVAAAYAHELPKYGLGVGLKNYSAAYCVGLLLARRVLTKFGLADTYKGQEEPDGEDFNVEPAEEGPRPFRCLLDAGLKRTSTGAKTFAALKGALDGGLDIPHNEKRFVGWTKEEGGDAEVLKKYIYGGHVAEYMEEMEEEDPEKYNRHFAKYIDEDLDADSLEDKYKEVHEAIRANPVREKKARSKPAGAKRWQPAKLTYEERKEQLKQKLASLAEADDE